VATSRTTQEVQLEHPYWGAGVALVVISIILLAFDFGYLISCGNAHGICVDWGRHRVGTAALIAFFLVFIIGVVLIIYTGASSTVTTQTTPVPAAPAAPVTVVTPSSSPPPAGTSVNVNPPPGTT
jgi:hypothetical protein